MNKSTRLRAVALLGLCGIASARPTGASSEELLNCYVCADSCFYTEATQSAWCSDLCGEGRFSLGCSGGVSTCIIAGWQCSN
jgi:hypothetical protein